MTEGFKLHPKLAADTIPIGETELCDVLLMNDARFPWVILVPKRPDLRELYELEAADQIMLTGETSHIAQTMQEAYGADKTNVAALGNQVPQLHIHIIMRTSDDAAWPSPVWGQGTAIPYDSDGQKLAIQTLRACLP